jgi:putative ABC transport system permease protein
VGARRRTILFQFFSESLTIMLLGGFIGFVISSIVVRLVHSMPETITQFVGTPQISPLVAVSSVLILLTIGTIAGFIPAKNAASTNPITALRK